ncbi:MAG: 5-formyltetrahydrofolate cyclo-ligase [Pedobacter sp.]|jgi:5-formyltetrahydrofolate cyclo-ligase|uniref:5-formyltetrahydrofolate cyclo-ligase n=1 Tax=Pedobacter sp. TaxID=1411316 RepID=UPI0035619304
MLKSILRKQALQKRKNLTEEEIASLNKRLLAQFKKLDLSTIKTLHIFLPIIHQKEPDTFLLIEWLQKNHPEIQIIVPKSEFDSSLMSHHHYIDKEDLINNHYHIPEPQQAKPFNGIPDMVIVPLLAFDKNGYRVGYGKGFYDRFLQNISTQKIGLSFFDAVTEINDVHLNDIRLDKCITPNKIVEFNC